jgi:hypothetical protein
VGVIGKHLGLLAFGWVLTVWAAVMLAALVLLLRAERRCERLAGRAAAAAAPALAGVAERS